MEFSSIGLALLKQSEGLRAQVYNDVAGYPTIGYGHKLRPGECFPDGISEAFASNLLQIDVQAAERAVRDLVKVPLSQGQFDALVDFVFNLGVGRLASSTLLKVLNAGRYTDAAEQFLRWDQAGGKEVSALKERREAEAALWKQEGEIA
jgi:GH24 family phage-related lysozyme (muramidase)